MFSYEKRTCRPKHHNCMQKHQCPAFPTGLLDQNWRLQRDEVIMQKLGEKNKLSCSSPGFAMLRFMRGRESVSFVHCFIPRAYVCSTCNYSGNICWLIDWKKIKPNAIPTVLRKKKRGNQLNLETFLLYKPTVFSAGKILEKKYGDSGPCVTACHTPLK